MDISLAFFLYTAFGLNLIIIFHKKQTLLVYFFPPSSTVFCSVCCCCCCYFFVGLFRFWVVFFLVQFVSYSLLSNLFRSPPFSFLLRFQSPGIEACFEAVLVSAWPVHPQDLKVPWKLCNALEIPGARIAVMIWETSPKAECQQSPDGCV